MNASELFEATKELQDCVQFAPFMAWMEKEVTPLRDRFDQENRIKGNENRVTGVEVLARLEAAVGEAQRAIAAKAAEGAGA